MTAHAHYICLAIDWRESGQFDDASYCQRLAWIELLCYAKSDGHGQRERKVPWNPERFAKRFRVDLRATKVMVDRAVSDGAVRVNGDTLAILNWGKYQERGRKAAARAAPQDREDKQDRQDNEDAPSLISQSKPQSAALSVSDCLTEDSEQSARTPEQWLRSKGIRDPLRRKVVALKVTVADLEREYTSVGKSARNPALVACRQIFDARGVDWESDPRLSAQLQRIEAMRKRAKGNP